MSVVYRYPRFKLDGARHRLSSRLTLGRKSRIVRHQSHNSPQSFDLALDRWANEGGAAAPTFAPVEIRRSEQLA